ncbi:ISL3-like element ISEc53 family transposase [Spirochaetota bacterium]
MEDRELYQKLLGISQPWNVKNVELNASEGKVTVTLDHDKGTKFKCPECNNESAVYDHRKRQWRHLDSCGFITIIEADVPRIECSVHKIRQVSVPWAETGSRFTAMFEALAISWLRAASTNDVRARLKISWDEAWGIMTRSVDRGLARRKNESVKELAIDETSFQKRHEYVTVIVDREKGHVIDVLDDRKKKTLKSWLETNKHILSEIRSVSMDMWDPFINAVKESIDDADSKICFDRFHVAGYFGKALDKVRATEHRTFGKKDSPLNRTKHDWLRTKKNGGYKHRNTFLKLTRRNLKTARAWRIKEAASCLWSYSYEGVAKKNWLALLGWIARCRLEPMKKVGKMVRSHLWGILNAIRLKATNAIAESINATIQKIKARACGFRSRSRFRTAILFHRGGLSLLPSGTF